MKIAWIPKPPLKRKMSSKYIGIMPVQVNPMVKFYHEGSEPVLNICKTFGCGKELTMRESLFGNYCAGHSSPGELVGIKKPDTLAKAIDKIIISKLN